MAGMSVSTGLISGIDYQTMISQLMQVEANPQSLLKNQLTATQSDATAYRAVNTRFDTLRSAAAALNDPAAWTATKASSSSTAVTATAGPAALAGSVTFAVDRLATSHSMITDATWTGTDQAYGAGSISITSGGTTTAVTITSSTAGDPSLADAVAAINADPKAGVTATAVQVSTGSYRLQLTAKASGADAVFTIGDNTGYKSVVDGVDAKVTVGTGIGKYEVTSATNTFTGLMADTTFTVSKADPAALVTVSVAKDPSAAATKVKNLVDAANGLLDSITSYTDPKSATALLKGDSTLRGLANEILDVVSSAIGGASASIAGVQTTRDGKLTFDTAVFTAKLASDPTVVRDLFTKKTITSTGADGISGNADDVTAPVGIAARLEALAKGASDATTGSLTLLAKSQDARATDLTERIADWDTRLAMRKDTITRQFTAMEKALGTMQNQASWLNSQIAGLPSWSKSNS